MDNKGAIARAVTLVLGMITFGWLLLDIYEVNSNLHDFIFGEAGWIGLIGYLFIFAFHVSAFIFIIFQFRYSETLHVLKVATLVAGVLSLFALGVEKVMFDEIGREYYMEGGKPGEVKLLYIAFAINVIFNVLAFFLIFKSYTIPSVRVPDSKPKDEIVFTIAQYMGIVSGLMGIVLTVGLITWQTPGGRFWVFLPFYFLFLLPYIITVCYWLSLKRREKILDWYDEKQWTDMLKASLTTLLLLVPGLALLLLIQKPVLFYWFPYYVFLMLLFFSASTLYFFKMR